MACGGNDVKPLPTMAFPPKSRQAKMVMCTSETQLPLPHPLPSPNPRGFVTKMCSLLLEFEKTMASMLVIDAECFQVMVRFMS